MTVAAYIFLPNPQFVFFLSYVLNDGYQTEQISRCV